MTEPNRFAIFQGPDALKEYLDPERHPLLPMVELPESLNPFYGDGVHLYIKMPPPLSMKHFGALGMLRAAATNPGFAKKKISYVPSSGNMGLVLSLLARVVYNFKSCFAVVPADIATGKLMVLKVTGTKAVPDDTLPEGYDSMSYAQMMGAQEGAHYFAQYEDPSNADGYIPLFRQIWEQMGGQISAISFGCGTAGLGKCMHDSLKNKGSSAFTIAAHSSDEDQLPGMRSESRLKKVKLYDPRSFDHAVEVSTYAGYRLSYELCKHGLLLGPSSGAALEAMFQTLAKLKEKGKLAAGNYVSIGHDTSLVVLDKYTTQLRKEDFLSA